MPQFWLRDRKTLLPLTVGLSLLTVSPPVLALPPADDQPEEVLRAQIIIGARSPIDGSPLTAAEYAELQAQLEPIPPSTPVVSPKVRKIIGLLKLRRFIKRFLPFIPIK
ncbi:hypothetical protein [Pantanalinema sp. GBBB05]|uniref:hypothetical protein n=1 Tax=Pantanalinema sp. GBBB05 TaxID=2604139 RepID=UPI001D522545|nr:hypothetical protein [Pantanalinema sp. GBBB05]